MENKYNLYHDSSFSFPPIGHVISISYPTFPASCSSIDPISDHVRIVESIENIPMLDIEDYCVEQVAYRVEEDHQAASPVRLLSSMTRLQLLWIIMGNSP